MSVVQGKRGENKLEVFVKARNLSVYTTRICSNQKTFDPQYYSTTNKIMSVAQQIFIDVWSANNIYVKSSEEYHERHKLQQRAQNNCNSLLALIQIAHTLYHLDYKRIKYWGNNTIEVRTLISKWKSSDRERYKE